MPIYVVGTYDTKGAELRYICDLINKAAKKAILVDVSTKLHDGKVDIKPQRVAEHHPKGKTVVFCEERGEAVTQMSIALENFIVSQNGTFQNGLVVFET